MFPYGSTVTMDDGSLAPVQSLESGDGVMCMDRGSEIHAVMCGGFDGELALVSVGMQTTPLLCTRGTLVSCRKLRTDGCTWEARCTAGELDVGDLIEVYDVEGSWRPGSLVSYGSVFAPVEYVSSIRYKGDIYCLFGARYCVDGFVVA